ncbi:hypothetical protein [Bordetella sp. LUAb4]|uniref:hypothetical protein n=1 Tax=Bordetella sp. LUAb4 TaxID=2843195 RepID=UPI001E4B43BA|nr:hypothetical protein [Bordetella sp. LUAb4]
MNNGKGLLGTWSGRRLALAAVLLGPVLLGGLAGCSILRNPYSFPEVANYCAPGASSEDSINTACRKLPQVSKAVGTIAGETSKMASTVTERVVTSQIIDAATFALATGFAVKVIHGGGVSNSARNIALAAGATYTAGSLFYPRSTEELYMQAGDVLACVAQSGNDLLIAYGKAQATADNRWPELNDLGISNICKAEPKYKDMRLSQSKLREALASVELSDSALADMLAKAKEATLKSLRQQLLGQRPSPQAYLNAGNSALAAAGTLLSNYSGRDSNGAEGKITRSTLTNLKQRINSCSPEEELEFDKAKADFEQATLAFNASVNVVGDVAKSCSTSIASPITALAVSQAAVTLHPGEDGIVIVVSGGRPPLRASWVGASPNDADATFTWLVADQQIKLREPAGGKAGTSPYTLRVSDSSLVPLTADIAVTTSAK